MIAILGVVFAGGQSTRFGSDKALALMEGFPLIAHAARLLRPFVAVLAISGRPVMDGFDLAIPDWPNPQLGPLGGLCGALRYGEAHGYSAILSLPCDTPDVPPSALSALLTHGGPAYLQDTPVIGLWPCRLATALSAHLAADLPRSVRGWSSLISAEPIAVDARITNVNRPQDLAQMGRE